MCIHAYIHICLCICAYIYIERERESVYMNSLARVARIGSFVSERLCAAGFQASSTDEGASLEQRYPVISLGFFIIISNGPQSQFRYCLTVWKQLWY